MKEMNLDSHPVDYPSLIACSVMFLFSGLSDWFAKEGAHVIHSIFQGMEYGTAVIGFVLTVSRFVDWFKIKFLNKKAK